MNSPTASVKTFGLTGRSTTPLSFRSRNTCPATYPSNNKARCCHSGGLHAAAAACAATERNLNRQFPPATRRKHLPSKGLAPAQAAFHPRPIRRFAAPESRRSKNLTFSRRIITVRAAFPQHQPCDRTICRRRAGAYACMDGDVVSSEAGIGRMKT